MTWSQVAVIGAPLDLGAGRRGVDIGPSAIRVASLDARLASLGYTVTDIGNVEVKQAESMDSGPPNARFLPEIAQACRKLASMVESAAAKQQFPLVLGGDPSIAVGTVSGLARHYRKKKQSIGLIWVDAHADMNTPKTSPSGNVHGMPLACLIGEGPRELTHLYNFAPKVNPKNVVLVGLRDLDKLEKAIIRKSGVHAYTMREIDERGLRAVMEDALRIACSDTAGFHLSFDMDSVDPQFAPGVGTPVRGGITYREAHLAMEIANDCGRMLGLEMVEVNPIIDEVNRTAELAVELVLSALGKKIL